MVITIFYWQLRQLPHIYISKMLHLLHNKWCPVCPLSIFAFFAASKCFCIVLVWFVSWRSYGLYFCLSRQWGNQALTPPFGTGDHGGLLRVRTWHLHGHSRKGGIVSSLLHELNSATRVRLCPICARQSLAIFKSGKPILLVLSAHWQSMSWSSCVEFPTKLAWTLTDPSSL